MKEPRQAVGWAFWLRWVVISAIGSGAGVLVWLAVGAVLETAGIGSPDGLPGILLSGLIGFAFGAPFGLAQWIVLRRIIPRAGRWVWATALGYGAVFLLGAAFLTNVSAEDLTPGRQILLGAMLGVAVAIPSSVLQWLFVLRNQVTRAGWWILASMLSWALGFATSFALRLAFGELTFIAGPVAAIALSGLALMWLLRDPDLGRRAG